MRKNLEPLWPTDENSEWLLEPVIEDGVAYIIRSRYNLDLQRLKKTHTYSVSSVWPYKAVGQYAMPSKAVESNADRFEERIDEALIDGWLGIDVAVVTGNYKRQALWYTSDPSRVKSILDLIITETSKCPVTFSILHDPTWAEYSKILSRLNVR